jgi:hypothetical protein
MTVAELAKRLGFPANAERELTRWEVHRLAGVASALQRAGLLVEDPDGDAGRARRG